MRLKYTSSPSTLPVSLAEAKLHLRVTTSTEDDMITEMIKSARHYVEGEMGIKIMQVSAEGYMDSFPSGNFIEIPVYPVTGIDKIEYFAPDTEAYSVFSSGDWVLDSSRKYPRVYLKPDHDWPDTSDQVNSVKVTFNAGYPSASDVPENWKAAIKLVVSNLFENRGDEGHKTFSSQIKNLILKDTIIEV